MRSGPRLSYLLPQSASRRAARPRFDLRSSTFRVPDALSAFIDGTVGSPYAIAASINRSIAFALVGIGFVIANRANLINVGGEGQIAVGGIAATAVALYGAVAGLPSGLPFIMPMLAAVVAGAIWGAIAGVLKIKAGTNEVISTLLLSFIAVWLVYWCVQSPALLRKPMTSSATLPESLEIPDPTKLPLLTGDYSFPAAYRPAGDGRDRASLPRLLLSRIAVRRAAARGRSQSGRGAAAPAFLTRAW